MLFKYREPRWYFWGLRVGLLNLFRNRTALGLKKTLGKIFQPLNSYTRFPEYHFLGQAIEHFIAEEERERPLVVLDIGSPKLFGLYLAYHYDIEIYLTDISHLNIDEYIILWNAIRNKARGRILFERQDGRALSYSAARFDIVYSMSVVEHVEGDSQDSKMVSEAWRVLKPGGLLLVSVPFGNLYMEQSIMGFAHATEVVDDKSLYFFQRVYDQSTIQTRLLASLSLHPDNLKIWTVFRRKSFLTQLYHRLRLVMGENVNGLLGFINPFLSLLLNRHKEGLYMEFLTSYAPVHSLRDIYGDLILACHKPGRMTSNTTAL
jgi:SAM-dependent methyltransferase